MCLAQLIMFLFPGDESFPPSLCGVKDQCSQLGLNGFREPVGIDCSRNVINIYLYL